MPGDGDRPRSPEVSSIAECIEAEGGLVTFARFMELALTHPTLGYYSRAGRLLRHHGDFSTAPALSPFFNATLARLLTELVEASLTAADGSAAAPPGLQKPSVVELGGGEGHLAEGVLRFWDEQRPDLRDRTAYRIVEIGAKLRQRQAAAVEALSTAGWDVAWGADLEQACAGTRPAVMFGNEFVDALPVHLVSIVDGAAREEYVKPGSEGLEPVWGDLSDATAAEIELLFGTNDPQSLAGLTDDGTLEVRPAFRGLLRRMAAVMPCGSLVTIDYGEWFRGVSDPGEDWSCVGQAGRRRTVRGYFKHQMVLDSLARPGRQDLTADVDFAALDRHGREAGFETVLLTTLAAFLRAGGAEQELQALRGGCMLAAAAADPLENDRQATVLEGLLDEEGLGGAFKLMVQVRG